MPPLVTGPILEGQYDPRLVVLSCFIAVFASFASLNLADRLRSSTGTTRLVWLSSASIALGGGIWSMHFVAMLALAMPIAIAYDITWTSASLLLAIVAVAIGFAARAMTYNSMVYPRLFDQWERSSMCNRCGNVFVG